MLSARDIETAMDAHERLLRRAIEDQDWEEAEALSRALVDLRQRQRLLEALGDTGPKQ